MKRMILSARDQAMAKLVAEETAKAIAVELRAIIAESEAKS